MRLLTRTIRELYTLEYISYVEFRDWIYKLVCDGYELESDCEILLITSLQDLCEAYGWGDADDIHRPSTAISALDWCIPIGGPVIIGIGATEEGGPLYVVPESLIREYPILLTHFEYAYDWCL